MVEFRRDWFFQIDVMQREVGRLLDHITETKPPVVKFAPRIWEPAVDVYETPDEVVVVVELAGVRKEEMEIIVERNRFLIRGERRKLLYGTQQTYSQMEIPSGLFEREISLPVAVDPEGCKASYRDGLVEVILPKLGRRVHKIEIKTPKEEA